MSEEWIKQMQNQVNSLEKLEKYINVTDDEKQAIEKLNTRWGVSPYFASLMDKDDPKYVCTTVCGPAIQRPPCIASPMPCFQPLKET